MGANRFLQTLICIHFASLAFDLFLFSNCVVPHARKIDLLNLGPVISLFIDVNNTKEMREAKRSIRCFPLESKNETHQSPKTYQGWDSHHGQQPHQMSALKIFPRSQADLGANAIESPQLLP